MDTNLEDALTAYSKFNLFDNTNRAVRIEQRLSYLNKPRYLSFLYEMNPEYLELEWENNLFLNEEGKNLNNVIYRKYTRNPQDKMFDKADLKKEYFILRTLEKIFLEKISEFLAIESRYKHNKQYEFFEYIGCVSGTNIKEEKVFKYNLLKEILKIRQQT
ncbi:MAG: hypothetical protein AB2392_21915, partial [Neobacillus sp.]